MGYEIRRPRAEGRKKAEVRRAKSEGGEADVTFNNPISFAEAVKALAARGMMPAGMDAAGIREMDAWLRTKAGVLTRALLHGLMGEVRRRVARGEDATIGDLESDGRVEVAVQKSIAAGEEEAKLRAGGDIDGMFGEEPAASGEVADSGVKPEALAEWRGHMRSRMPAVRRYQAAVHEALLPAQMEMLGSLRERRKIMNSEGSGAAMDFMFDLRKFKLNFESVMRAAGLSAFESAGAQAFVEMGKDDPFKETPAAVQRFLADRENKMAHTPQDIFDQVKSGLAEGFERGETMSELAGRVKAAFGDIEKGRAMTIAMTETGAAYGQGRNDAQKQVGAKWKRWLTSGNANVRAAHRMVNGEVIPFDDSFTMVDERTGEADEIRFPGDPDGEPWNVINCHCVCGVVLKGPGGDA
jgi:SPP1 gp7 family putative phage head morphogenesis protein